MITFWVAILAIGFIAVGTALKGVGVAIAVVFGIVATLYVQTYFSTTAARQRGALPGRRCASAERSAVCRESV